MKSYNLWLVEEEDAELILKVLKATYGEEAAKKVKQLGELRTEIESFPYITLPVANECKYQNLETSMERICKGEDSEKNLMSEVTKLLKELGCPANLLGYKYLREGVIMAVNNTAILDSITKSFYPAIAKKCGTTPARVERAIRHAIEVACERGNQKLLDELFSYTISNTKGKPTNSEFVSLVVDKIRLSM